MNFGKLAAGGLVALGLIAGGAVWWLQEYAFYQPVTFVAGQEFQLTSKAGGRDFVAVKSIEAIDADSSPLRFRACLTLDLPLAEIEARYAPHPAPTPLNGPSWFDCYDAAKIGAALEKGEAKAFMAAHEIAPDVDRILAVFADGRAYAWHQINKAEESPLPQ